MAFSGSHRIRHAVAALMGLASGLPSITPAARSLESVGSDYCDDVGRYRKRGRRSNAMMKRAAVKARNRRKNKIAQKQAASR
jgi:hypothetical protein